jgi:Domain of unknown function (DUF4340)
MIKKLTNTQLLLILLALLAVFGIFRYISIKKGENTFQTNIVPKIDSVRLNGIIIYPRKTKGSSNLPYVFAKKGKDWYVSQGDVTSRAEPRSSNYLIKLIEEISPDRLGSNDPKDWKQYNVNDSLGTRVVFFYDKDTALDLVVGRFSYIPEKKQAISYVRLWGHTEVYAVDGFLTMNITEDFNAWRDKKAMPGTYASWTKLTFSYPSDSGFVIHRDSGDRWIFGNGALPDSATSVKVIQDISNQNYGSFINKFDTTGKQPLFTLRIEGSDFSSALIEAYLADSTNVYAIHSSVNPGAFFSGGKGNGMFSKVFPGKSAFNKKAEEKKQAKTAPPKKLIKKKK